MPMPTLRYPVKRYAESTDDGEYHVIEGVPILDEHVDDEGVVYDRALLERVAQNNNDRIEDTGDYVPLVIGHTSDDGSKDPPVIGFAGPFRVIQMGKKKPRYAISAVFRIFKDKLDEFRSRPRRSVEIWPEDKPENRYIDPIALLGAETPRRDLGLVYNKLAPEKKPTRYEMDPYKEKPLTYAASAPGGGNTFIPPAGTKKPRYAEEETMPDATLAASPEVINQIIEGLKPTIQQMVEEAIAPLLANMDDEASLEDDAGTIAAEDELAGEAPMPGGEPLPGEDLMAGGEEPMPGEGMPMEGGEIPEEERPRFQKMYEKMAERYALGSDKADFKGAKQYCSSMDESDRKQLTKYMNKYACGESKAIYEKCCVTDSGKTQMSKQRSGGDAKQYQKLVNENASLKSRYQKAQEENASLKDELIENRKALRYAKYHAGVTELQREGVVLERDDEVEFLMSMPEEAADHHLNTVIPTKYQRVPTGSVPVDQLVQPMKYIDPEAEKRERYHKAAERKTNELRQRGKSVSYVTVLKAMCEANSEDVEISV